MQPKEPWYETALRKIKDREGGEAARKAARDAAARAVAEAAADLGHGVVMTMRHPFLSVWDRRTVERFLAAVAAYRGVP